MRADIIRMMERLDDSEAAEKPPSKERTLADIEVLKKNGFIILFPTDRLSNKYGKSCQAKRRVFLLNKIQQLQEELRQLG